MSNFPEDGVSFSEGVYARLAASFGGTVHSWPFLAREAPKWWQFKRRAYERSIRNIVQQASGRVLGEWERRSFYVELRRGQLLREDAGGFLWRCWCAALDLPFNIDGPNYPGIEAMFRDGAKPSEIVSYIRGDASPADREGRA